MPKHASFWRKLLNRAGGIAFFGGLLTAASGCHGLHAQSDTNCETCDPSAVDGACSHCGDADCNKRCCIKPQKYIRCMDERRTIHDALRRANVAMRQDYASEPSIDVQSGYRDAYIDVALGASGEIPPVPPERYWNVCFRTADGHARAQDWFAGYAVGAGRALATCRQQYNYVPSSGTTAYSDERTDGNVNPGSVRGVTRTPAGHDW